MKIGGLFVKQNLAVAKQIKKALQIQHRTGGSLGEILLAVTNMRAIDYHKTLAVHYGIEFVDLLSKKPDISLLNYEDHDIYLSKLSIPIKKEDGIFTVATANFSSEVIAFIKQHWGEESCIVGTAKFDILSVLQNKFHEDYLNESINNLINTNIAFSAKHTFSTWQIIFLIFILSASIFLFIFNLKYFFILLNIFLTISVTAVLVYKLVLSIIALLLNVRYRKINLDVLPKKHLPIYTILIPLYKEKEITLKNLFFSLKKMHYPKHKLDIKLLLEQDDESTIDIVKKSNLPSHYHIVYIPAGMPRTKAKACNYGLKFAHGDYVTLYDAEDKPNPYQLKMALYAFLHDKSNKLACVQSRLNFYNSNENWLTRMFTIEYTYWFDLLLPALEYLHTPIPLGGTSNHFKTSVLKELDAWDPYNVAEDADLGIRLERLGYKTKMIRSTTYEEANCDLINWIKQRTRWIKGYMQTYIVHMRHPFKLWRALGTRGFLGFQLFLGGTIFSNLSYIILWTMFIFSFALTPEQNIYFFYVNEFNFVMGTAGIIILNLLGILRRKKYSLAFFALTSPLYWLLMSLASYRALYQIFFHPSLWEKTEHGISKMLK
jgi:cellulose synthase/poly-beta-1,6-N-acetylglucosamine synthase-like glycosyltransferase